MAAKTIKASSCVIDLGRPNSEPQKQYFASRAKYNLFGGARGGGKSWCTQRKSVGMCLKYPGLKVLIVRRSYEDLQNSIIDEILKIVPESVARYNSTQHLLTFYNGSYIKFGNMESYGAATTGKYQGSAFHVIFFEELTQFTEAEFRGLCACCRSADNLPTRIYATANPGGVGHQFCKRLWIKRDFLPGENPEDYAFFKCGVEDNKDLNQDYINALDLLPEDIRRAHRYGDWDALSGGYFPEFTVRTHVIKDFAIDPSWTMYRAFDYGLDMFACLWVACDPNGRYYVYREFAEPGLVVSDAARAALSVTQPWEHIPYTIAPPDMWSTLKDSGKTMADVFMQSGMPIIRANNSRVQGWMALKEMLKPMADGRPGLLVFESCKGLIDDLQAIQHDDKNPSDCAKQPHELTHRPDALRYFAQMRTLPPETKVVEDDEDWNNAEISYEDALCGGEPGTGYLWH